jgi:protoheme IX farnesyltransferase
MKSTAGFQPSPDPAAASDAASSGATRHAVSQNLGADSSPRDESVRPVDTAPSAQLARTPIGADFAELVKARLTGLVLLTTAVGFYLGVRGPMDYRLLVRVFLGTAAAAAGAAALNQWWEWQLDGLMQRTRSRPVPAGRMRPVSAFVVGSFLSLAGIIYLWFGCNGLSALLAAITVAIYIFAYTPLKRVSTFNTLIGAVPGALPPVIGWAAARGSLGAGAWSLFTIVFLWQLPHFFAIAWMYRDDYARAGFQMISSDDPTGERSASQSVFFCILLLVLAGLPGFVGVVNFFYIPVELALGAVFVVVAMRFLRTRARSDARLLFITSIMYLPLLLAALVFTKI